jgi:hypothetical protein
MLLGDLQGFGPVQLLLGFVLMLLIWVGIPAFLIYRVWRWIETVRVRRRCLTLPQALADKAASVPESPSGERVVTLVLSDGRRVNDVVVACGSIKEILGMPVRRPADLDFEVKQVVDVCHV